MSNFENENEFVNFLREARDPMDKHCLAGRFLYHYIHEPHVYKLFEKFTLELTRKRLKSSAWLVANRMRWEEKFSTEEDFKVTNDFIGLYARMFMARHPQYNNFFQVNKMYRIFGL